MVSQADLVKGSLKRLSKKTKTKLKSLIAEKGASAGAVFLTKLIAQKTGLPQEQAAVISLIIAKKSVKEIRDKLKF